MLLSCPGTCLVTGPVIKLAQSFCRNCMGAQPGLPGMPWLHGPLSSCCAGHRTESPTCCCCLAPLRAHSWPHQLPRHVCTADRTLSSAGHTQLLGSPWWSGRCMRQDVHYGSYLSHSRQPGLTRQVSCAGHTQHQAALACSRQAAVRVASASCDLFSVAAG